MSIKLKSTSGGSVSLDPVSSLASDISLTLPDSVGSAGQFLKNSGTAGTLEFGDLPASGLSLTRATAQATTSGTSVDFTGIPANTKRITVMLYRVSPSASQTVYIRIGSGSFVTSGYLAGAATGTGSGTFANSSQFFPLTYSNNQGAANTYSGNVVLTNQNSTLWTAHGVVYASNYGVGAHISGSVEVQGDLDRVQLALSGVGAFDGGAVNIMYEVQA